MLYGLRQGAPLYVLYKTSPKVETLEVVSVSNPVPQFPTYTAGAPVSQPMRIGDIQARRGDETVKCEKGPADVPIADFGPTSGIVLSESRDAILSEIASLKKASERALAEESKHRHIVTECEKMEKELNPALVKEAENTQRLDNLEQRLDGLTNGMASLDGTLSEIRGLLKSSGRKKED